MSAKKNIDVTSRIATIKLIDFSVETPGKKEKIDPLAFVFKYEVNVQQYLTKGFRIKCKILIFSNMDQNTLLGTIETYGEFEVINLKEIQEHFANNIPSDLLALFTGILISSTRGMLIIKSENTILEGIMIPIMDPKVFFTPEAIKPSTGKNL